MSKKSIILLIGLIFLVASIFYDIKAKKEYIKNKEELTQEVREVKNIIALKNLWSAKALKSKIKSSLNTISNKKLTFKRRGVELVANNLSYRELNHILNKFASMPLQFKKLDIKKVGSNFNLECLCEW